MPVPGIHHISAICADPQRNVDFYVGLLGLRLVKKTVNFDDPGTYHLYYGDGIGSPGTIMTFFAWVLPPMLTARGRQGTGQVTAVAFSIPADAIEFWVAEGERGRMGIGAVHHIAWRAHSGEEQLEWRGRLAEAGMDVTPVLDRNYFKSIYYREPGGVLFEIATDLPGFTVDEPPAELGSRLKLPSWLESRRSALEARLPELRLPKKR